MEKNPFQTREANILENDRIRVPQREAYAALETFASDPASQEREIGVVLPVGLASPDALRSRRLHSGPPEPLWSRQACRSLGSSRRISILPGPICPTSNAAFWMASPSCRRTSRLRRYPHYSGNVCIGVIEGLARSSS